MMTQLHVWGVGSATRYQSKAIELLTRTSGELGSLEAMCNLASFYSESSYGLERKRAISTMQGNIQPRYYNLGSNEGRKGNNVRVAKHFAIAARSGDDDALTLVREEFQVEL